VNPQLSAEIRSLRPAAFRSAWLGVDMVRGMAYRGLVNKEQILVAFGTSDAGALGNIWRITAQSTDFYVKALRIQKVFHLSVHGPNNRHPDGHRFHVKIDSDAANRLKARGDFLMHTIPADGVPFDGRPVGSDAYHVARIRWHEELQRPEFRQAATYGPLPDTTNIRAAARTVPSLRVGQAADIDLIVSYGEPCWPDAEKTLQDNSRVQPPVRNDAGMWLTATSYLRPDATPDELRPPLPEPGDVPRRFLGAGPIDNIYWLAESITSQRYIDALVSQATA
jgi:hypothetical protein